MPRLFALWSVLSISAVHLCIVRGHVESVGDCSSPIDVSNDVEHQHRTALLQLRATRHDQVPDVSFLDGEAGSGSTAPLNEEGYKIVANTRDPVQMESFMLRLISGLGLRVRDHAGLLGVLPFYDGESTVQSFSSMKAELLRTIKRQSGWVTAQPEASVSNLLSKGVNELDDESGAAVPLTESGYREVAAKNNTVEMKRFVRRVVADLGLCVEDEGGISGVSLWYSGERDIQSFAALRAEVINASKHDGTWILPPPCK